MSEDYSLRTRIQEIVDLINDVREEYGMALDFAFVVSLLERNEDGDVEMTRMGATSYDIEELYEEAEEHVHADPSTKIFREPSHREALRWESEREQLHHRQNDGDAPEVAVGEHEARVSGEPAPALAVVVVVKDLFGPVNWMETSPAESERHVVQSVQRTLAEIDELRRRTRHY